MAHRLQYRRYQGRKTSLGQNGCFQHQFHVFIQFRPLIDGLKDDGAAARMAMYADVVGAGQVRQGLVENTGVVLDSAVEVFDRHFPVRCFGRYAVYGNVIVAAGQQDQFGGWCFVGLGEVAVIFQKTVDANNGLFGLAAMIADGNGACADAEDSP